MAKNSDIIFRSSMSGYNKKDVNDYIEQSEIAHKKTIEEYEGKLAELTKKLDDANERAEIAERKDFSAEAAEYEMKISELNEKLAESEMIITAKTEENSVLSHEIDAAQTKVELLSKKVAEIEVLCQKSHDNIEKANKYDEISAKIGDVFLNAQNRAEAIITEAERKSSELIAETESKRTKTVDLLNQYAEMCRDKISEITVASAKERLERLNNQMHEFEESISKALMNVREQSGSFELSLDDLRSSIESNLDSILESTSSDNN